MFKRDLEKVLGGSIARVDTRRGQDIYGDFSSIGGQGENFFREASKGT